MIKSTFERDLSSHWWRRKIVWSALVSNLGSQKITPVKHALWNVDWSAMWKQTTSTEFKYFLVFIKGSSKAFVFKLTGVVLQPLAQSYTDPSWNRSNLELHVIPWVESTFFNWVTKRENLTPFCVFTYEEKATYNVSDQHSNGPETFENRTGSGISCNRTMSVFLWTKLSVTQCLVQQVWCAWFLFDVPNCVDCTLLVHSRFTVPVPTTSSLQKAHWV